MKLVQLLLPLSLVAAKRTETSPSTSGTTAAKVITVGGRAADKCRGAWNAAASDIAQLYDIGATLLKKTEIHMQEARRELHQLTERIHHVSCEVHECEADAPNRLGVAVNNFFECTRKMAARLSSGFHLKVTADNLDILKPLVQKFIWDLRAMVTITHMSLGDILGGDACYLLLKDTESCCATDFMHSNGFEEAIEAADEHPTMRFTECNGYTEPSAAMINALFELQRQQEDHSRLGAAAKYLVPLQPRKTLPRPPWAGELPARRRRLARGGGRAVASAPGGAEADGDGHIHGRLRRRGLLRPAPRHRGAPHPRVAGGADPAPPDTREAAALLPLPDPLLVGVRLPLLLRAAAAGKHAGQRHQPHALAAVRDPEVVARSVGDHQAGAAVEQRQPLPARGRAGQADADRVRRPRRRHARLLRFEVPALLHQLARHRLPGGLPSGVVHDADGNREHVPGVPERAAHRPGVALRAVAAVRAGRHVHPPRGPCHRTQLRRAGIAGLLGHRRL
ncbi:uncharacterized protein BcabD6B2_30780 [Babesia caballi]|uniref:Uncharacterized protein n=1 Tax=Babesia caballi TaxID=5871 RepID=A0AAV4LU00_BABCB|nr:hypothetical protein, conserved [Babesia caballi]